MHTHSDRLERWLGAEQVARVSRAMHDFYWPVALHGVPGAVRAMPGGDFTGEIRAGQEMSAVDRAVDYLHRERRRAITRAGHLKRQAGAFGSLDALVAAATAGKKQDITFQKVGSASNSTASETSLWRAGNQPAAGGAAAAAPGGTVPTSATTGALGFFNAPANANTHHFVAGYAMASVAGNTLLLYDRIFAAAKTMNSTATEAVTGVPTRYTNQATGNDDYIGGNFCFPECGTVLPATAHNWTVCQYTDQAGNAANSFAATAGISACVANGIDLPTNSWFLPLAAGDTGVKALTQMQCSALVATGTIDFVIGHPIAFFPCPIAQLICTVDGVYTAFNLTRVYDNACLAFIEMPKPANTGTTYTGQVSLVSE
jgi:hypothetical protein